MFLRNCLIHWMNVLRKNSETFERLSSSSSSLSLLRSLRLIQRLFIAFIAHLHAFSTFHKLYEGSHEKLRHK